MNRFEYADKCKNDIKSIQSSIMNKANILWEMAAPYGELYYTIQCFSDTLQELEAGIDLDNLREIVEAAERRWIEVRHLLQEEAPGLYPENLGINEGLSAIRHRLR